MVNRGSIVVAKSVGILTPTSQEEIDELTELCREYTVSITSDPIMLTDEVFQDLVEDYMIDPDEWHLVEMEE